jgi:hypothetical protein
MSTTFYQHYRDKKMLQMYRALRETLDATLLLSNVLSFVSALSRFGSNVHPGKHQRLENIFESRISKHISNACYGATSFLITGESKTLI